MRLVEATGKLLACPYNTHMSNDTFFIAPENLIPVLSSFFKIFKSNPLAYVSMDEAVALFDAEHALNEDGEYQITENDLKEFMHKINGMQVDRMMVDMDKKGLAILAHDGEQLFLLPKENKGY